MIAELQAQIEKVDFICCQIEQEEEYLGELMEYLPVLNQVIQVILACAKDPEIPFDINEAFVLQILKDIIYGIEHKDAVFLLDTLRYGLQEVYRYTIMMLQGEGEDE